MKRDKEKEASIATAEMMAKILPFIEELTKNNDRDWFAENRDRYLEVKNTVELFTQTCINVFKSFDSDLSNVTAKKSIFRIYRDTRFSHDKRPYKNHIGVFISKGGSHGDYSGYYMHFEPSSCIFGGGVYGLDSEKLKKVRQHIYYNSERFKKILNEPNFMDVFGKLEDGDKLKLPPKGFDKDFEDIDLLKYKNYTVVTRILDKEIEKSDFVDKLTKYAKILHPMNSFLNEAFNF